MRTVFLLISLALLGMGCGGNSDLKEMKKEIIVKTQEGAVVFKGQTLNNKLDGECSWFDSQGNELVKGDFRKGLPYEGSFLNWSLYFEELKEQPYDPESYCKDWVTPFEISFASVKPNYDQLVTRYSKGKHLIKKDD